MRAVLKEFPRCPIGKPGTPWGDAERAEWLSTRRPQRDYFTEVVSPLHRIAASAPPALEVFQYGSLDYRRFGAALYPLYAVRSAPWDPALPMCAVTGGVHGYETSGVQGAIQFVATHWRAVALGASGAGAPVVNLLVLPCVSPWGYEMIQRWNPEAVDPNRQFIPGKPGCPEAAAAMACIDEHAARSAKLIMHTDLHETTDSDNSEFFPARFARDGTGPDPWADIPDGFYTVCDAGRPALGFQATVVAAASSVTHIAEPDADGLVIGRKPLIPGVVGTPNKGLCGVYTPATFTTTTEVYPDSQRPGVTPEQCNAAQVAVVVAGVRYALAHHADPDADGAAAVAAAAAA